MPIPASPVVYPDKTLRGRDSRLLPQTEFGARARTEASVSMLRLLRLEDEASVRMLALSVRRPFEVAELYVVGMDSAMWRGIAEAVPPVEPAGETGY